MQRANVVRSIGLFVFVLLIGAVAGLAYSHSEFKIDKKSFSVLSHRTRRAASFAQPVNQPIVITVPDVPVVVSAAPAQPVTVQPTTQPSQPVTTPATQPTSSSIDIGSLERQVFDAVNAQRTQAGLSALNWNSEIANVARKHSAWQDTKNVGPVKTLFISHQDANGGWHYDRLKQGNVYYFGQSGENIYATGSTKSYTAQTLVSRAVNGWMNSPGHKQNILTSGYDEGGIGIAVDPTGTNYVFTQVFIKRASCGFQTGPACTMPGYYPYCFDPMKPNAQGVCQ